MKGYLYTDNGLKRRANRSETTSVNLTEDSFIRKIHNFRSHLKRALLIGGSSALIIAAPVSVAAHGNWHKDDRGRNNRGGVAQQDERRDRDRGDQDDRDSRRWWKPWGHRDDKPKPPVNPEVCAQWQDRLNQWVENFKNVSTKDIQFGTDYYAMVQNFVTTQGLTVENYAALTANVDAKQVAATTAMENVQARDLNCEADAEETTERGVERSSWRQAKQAMEEYKQSLKQLTESVRASYGGHGIM